jgi:hypothetical protein
MDIELSGKRGTRKRGKWSSESWAWNGPHLLSLCIKVQCGELAHSTAAASKERRLSLSLLPLPGPASPPHTTPISPQSDGLEASRRRRRRWRCGGRSWDRPRSLPVARSNPYLPLPLPPSLALGSASRCPCKMERVADLGRRSRRRAPSAANLSAGYYGF